MYGNKVIIIAKISMAILILIGVIMVFSNMDDYNSNKDYIEYATVNGGSDYSYSLEAYGNKAYEALSNIKLGFALIVISIVLYFPLAAFGELVDTTAKNNDILRKISSSLESIDRKLDK